MSKQHRDQSSLGVSRRSFMGGAGLCAAGLLTGRSGAAEAEQPSYRVTGWSGDEFELQHKLRDGWKPKEPKTWKKHDVVVIGAGISGLTAAFKLRHMDLMVLETGAIGGTARSARYKSWDYNIGSAYIVGVEGEQGKLWSELGVKLQPVKPPLDSWFYKGAWYPEPWRDEIMSKLPPSFHKAMQGAKRAFKQISSSKDFPINPYAKATPAALALDRITAAEWLKPWAHPDLMEFMDAYGYGAMGAPCRVVSAYGFINFYVDVVEERAYAWMEGNYHLIKAMADHIRRAGADRIREHCAVHKVVPVSDDLARIYYTQNGESFGIEAKRVVVATPYFVAGRIIDPLPAAQKYALGCQSYCAYVAGSLCFDKTVSFDCYDNWTPSVSNFEDYLPAGWADQERAKECMKDGHVIGCFACSHYPVLTRFRMLTQKPEAFARRIVDSFEKIHPGSQKHLREVHMTRWGHAFIINRPGMVTRWLPSIRKRIGPIHLAHADGQGLPAVEASTNEAAAAAYAILGGWKKKA